MSDREIQRRQAMQANGAAWTLLEKTDRTPAETEAMIEAALESLRLWREAGTPVHAQRGHWIVARTAIAAGRADLAAEHADLTLAQTADHGAALEDFDFAFAEEIAARASALDGDIERARSHYVEATRLGNAIASDDDRKVFFQQLNSGPWFGLPATSHEPPETGED